MTLRQPTIAAVDAAEVIDRSSPLPLYVQIKRRLIQMITAWDRSDLRFHTDDELVRIFKVSRMTVRQAVQELVNEGHLTRMRGVGTFVGAEKMDESFTPAMDFITQWADRGRPLVLRLRRFERATCPPRYAASLGLAEDAPVVHLERLRSSGGIPISLDYRYILTDFEDAFDRGSVEQCSLLDLLRTRVELDRGVMRIEAASADGETAEILQVLPGDPVLVRHLVYLDTDGRPVMAGYSIYRADQSRYVVTVPVAKGAGGGAGLSSELRLVTAGHEPPAVGPKAR